MAHNKDCNCENCIQYRDFWYNYIAEQESAIEDYLNR